MTFSPFRIDVSDEVLDDLRARLARTRFTDRSADAFWQAGTDPDYLRDLVSYWIDGFDRRAREAELNRQSHYQTWIEGRRLHFVYARAVRTEDAPSPPPLILSHGWPSSFVEMLPLVDRLTNRARHSGNPADAFDVVVPSLPGFLYSHLPSAPLTRAAMAETFHRLMTDVLGYQRYGAFGGDIGGVVTGWMAALHPEHVVGIHMIHPPFPASFDARPLTPAEEAYLDAEAKYDKTDGGYSAIMATRPDTIAAALHDSPAGLAAWIVDKFRDWSDNHGDLEHSIDRDTLLTTITLYWASGTIGSSFRRYYDFRHNSQRPDITVPAAFTVSSEAALAYFPREIAERACTDIRQWSQLGRGGHFMPLEEPDLLAYEMSQFFMSLSREAD
jgi:pimeloyl-ACP methyl ester carboxylesterase